MSAARLRVLLTVDAVGGIWQYGVELARGLTHRGADVVLASFGPPASAAQRAEIEGISLVETGLPLDWLCDRPEPVLAAGGAIAHLVQDVRADVIQVNMPAMAAALRTDVPVVAVAHGCIATWWSAAKPDQPLAPELAWHRQLMGEGLRVADRVVAPTQSYARRVAREYGLSIDPTVVHNGRTSLPLPTSTVIADRAITVGRLWDKVKGAAVLDRVAARVGVPFLAIGAATAPHGERAYLQHLVPVGHLNAAALGAQLAERPIFVSAATFEPFGLAVIEAAQAGCALVLSDIDSFRELWDGAALFVPPTDEAAYVAAIEQLIGDRTLRLRLGEAARARAIRYTPQATADAMLAIYAAVGAGVAGRTPQGRAAA